MGKEADELDLDSDRLLDHWRDSEYPEKAGLFLHLGRDQFVLDDCRLCQRAPFPGIFVFDLFSSFFVGNLFLAEVRSMFPKKEYTQCGDCLKSFFCIAVIIALIWFLMRAF